jgi:hypothetical protein
MVFIGDVNIGYMTYITGDRRHISEKHRLDPLVDFSEYCFSGI